MLNFVVISFANENIILTETSLEEVLNFITAKIENYTPTNYELKYKTTILVREYINKCNGKSKHMSVPYITPPEVRTILINEINKLEQDNNITI